MRTSSRIAYTLSMISIPDYFSWLFFLLQGHLQGQKFILMCFLLEKTFMLFF